VSRAASLILFWLFETEDLRVFMLMAPDLLVWFTVFDVSLFVDVLIVTTALTVRRPAPRRRRSDRPQGADGRALGGLEGFPS